MTRTGIRRINKRVEAILNMTPPKNTREVHAFVGLVNYYRDMWARQSHLLHPLTALMPTKARFKWTDVEQKAFNDMKCTVSHNTLLAYQDVNKNFDIHTDEIDYQLGAVISQDSKPIAFYSRKPTKTKTQYTVMEKELLSIFETIKQLRKILLGQQLKIF